MQGGHLLWVAAGPVYAHTTQPCHEGHVCKSTGSRHAQQVSHSTGDAQLVLAWDGYKQLVSHIGTRPQCEGDTSMHASMYVTGEEQRCQVGANVLPAADSQPSAVRGAGRECADTNTHNSHCHHHRFHPPSPPTLITTIAKPPQPQPQP